MWAIGLFSSWQSAEVSQASCACPATHTHSPSTHSECDESSSGPVQSVQKHPFTHSLKFPSQTHSANSFGVHRSHPPDDELEEELDEDELELDDDEDEEELELDDEDEEELLPPLEDEDEEEDELLEEEELEDDDEDEELEEDEELLPPLDEEELEDDEDELLDDELEDEEDEELLQVVLQSMLTVGILQTGPVKPWKQVPG